MKAALALRYGSLVMREVERPEPAEGEVLVRVHATSLNAVDWYGLNGRPLVARPLMGLLKPKSGESGSDFAGVVEAVAVGVDGLAPGDEVYGCHGGAFAEYLATGKAVERKPANLSFEEAAAVPVAALTALQGLRDHGSVQPGQQVLVNGASGGVGTFAVQIAKALGASVHAVCSARNVDQARELGADRVFDYTTEDFTRGGAQYDVLFDNAGNRSWLSMRRVLAPHGTVVLVGGPRKRMFGPLGHVIRITLASKLSTRKAVFFMARPEPRRPRDAARPDRSRARDARDRATLRARTDCRGDARDERACACEDRGDGLVQSAGRCDRPRPVEGDHGPTV
jgi:NADPH:quinone reductase-like Zn-dependent oxidoreductase